MKTTTSEELNALRLELAEKEARVVRLEQRLAELGVDDTVPRPTPRASRLTATERSVAELVAVGRTNREIADRLFLSPKTVEWNLSKVYRKMLVRSRTELAAKFFKPGLADTAWAQ